jgi:hypothetical protein
MMICGGSGTILMLLSNHLPSLPIAPWAMCMRKDDWYQADVGDFLHWKVNAFDIRMVLFNYIFHSKALEAAAATCPQSASYT